MAAPLALLRALDLDYNLAVVVAPVAANALVRTVGDYYCFALADRMLGRKCALILVAYALFDKDVNMITYRPLTNGAEAACCVASLYYFSKLKYKDGAL